MGETNSTTIHTTSEMLDYAYGQLLDGYIDISQGDGKFEGDCVKLLKNMIVEYTRNHDIKLSRI